MSNPEALRQQLDSIMSQLMTTEDAANLWGFLKYELKIYVQQVI